MEAKTANQIPLEEILGHYDRNIIRSYSGYDMYLSPFRPETKPSFQVLRTGNTWKDFGSGEFGSAVDLVMKLENCSFPEAMRLFEENRFGYAPRHEIREPRTHKETEVKKVSISKIAPLRNKALLNYLRDQRGIDPDIATRFCQEVYYKREGSDKNLFAIAFRNDSGGSEYRNGAGYKGAFINKDITTITFDGHMSNRCAVFEGFMDFLTYQQMMKDKPEKQRINFVILNSVAMVQKAMPFLKRHTLVSCFLDNDPAGINAFNKIKATVPIAVNESSLLHPGSKDLNEFWISQQKKREMDNSRETPENKIRIR